MGFSQSPYLPDMPTSDLNAASASEMVALAKSAEETIAKLRADLRAYEARICHLEAYINKRRVKYREAMDVITELEFRIEELEK